MIKEMKRRILSAAVTATMLAGALPVMAANNTETSAIGSVTSCTIDFEDSELYSVQPDWSKSLYQSESLKNQNRPTHYISNGDKFKGSAAQNMWMIKEGYNVYGDISASTETTYESAYANLQQAITKNTKNDYSEETYPHMVKNQGISGWFGFGTDNMFYNYTLASGATEYTGYDKNDMIVTADGQNHSLTLAPKGNGTAGGKAYNNYSLFGKENIDVADKITMVEGKVKITDEGGGVRLMLATAANLNLDGVRTDTLVPLYYTKTFNQMIALCDNPAWFDAVTFKNNKVYAGNTAGAELCSYNKNQWYTVRYYLDLTNINAPKNTVVIYNDDGMIGYKKSTITINDANKYSEIKAFNYEYLGKGKTNPFEFKKSNRYAFAFSALSEEQYGNAACANVDDINFKAVSEVEPANMSGEFYQDFESYTTEKVTKSAYIKEDTTDSRTVEFTTNGTNGEYTGNAAFNLYTMDYTKNMLKDEYPADENGLQRPGGWYATGSGVNYTYINQDAAIKGGLKGYTGFSSHYLVRDNRSGCDIDDLTVVDDGGNKVLALAPSKFNTSAYRRVSFFGKQNVDIVNKVNVIKSKVKIVDDTTGDGFRINITRDNDFSKLKNEDWFATTPALQLLRNTNSVGNGPWYDAVTMKNGKVYLGDVSADNEVCEYTNGSWYELEYYLDLTDLANPKNILIVYDANGNMIASKIKDITLTAETTTAINSDETAKAGGALTTSYFDSFTANGKYSLMFTNTSGNNTNDTSKVYLDEISLGGVEEGVSLIGEFTDKTSGEFTAYITNATDSAINGAKVIAAVYEADSNELVGLNYINVDVAANTVMDKKTVTISNLDLPAKYYAYVYLWDNFNSIYPLTNAASVK